ncbi:hypothetical protein ACWDCL_28245 [Streptomyces sp. NPDC001009]
MEHELHSLRSKLGEVDDLDYELRDIRGDIRSLEDDLGTVRNDLTELDGRRPARRPRHHRPGVEEAGQDRHHGWNVRVGLLPGHQREAHRLNIRHHEQALEERDEHRDKVVEAAGVLASQPRTSREYKQAVWDFGMSRPLAEQHDQRAKKLAGPAQTARAALAQDDTLWQAKASLIEQGDKAERKLNWLLRGRLADAVRDRALLPMWFVTVLGPVPPAHKTQAWLVSPSKSWPTGSPTGSPIRSSRSDLRLTSTCRAAPNGTANSSRSCAAGRWTGHHSWAEAVNSIIAWA